MSAPAKRWLVGFLLLSIVQCVLFSSALWLCLELIGLRYKAALMVGSVFFALVVAAQNLLCIILRSKFAHQVVLWLGIALNTIAWGEDLNTYFFWSAVAGILIGAGVIVSRFLLVQQLETLLTPSVS